MEFENERMIDCHQDLLFELYIVNVVFFLQSRFVQNLHSIIRRLRAVIGCALLLALLALLHEEHFSETALPEQADNLDGPQIDLLAEVVWGVWAATLNDKIEQAYALFDNFLLQLLHHKVIQDVHAAIVPNISVSSRIGGRILDVALGRAGKSATKPHPVIVERLCVHDGFFPVAWSAAACATALDEVSHIFILR